MERPKEWEQERDRIICEYIAGSDPEDPDLGDIFEAGADAMLEVLLDEGVIYYGEFEWLQDEEAKE